MSQVEEEKPSATVKKDRKVKSEVLKRRDSQLTAGSFCGRKVVIESDSRGGGSVLAAGRSSTLNKAISESSTWCVHGSPQLRKYQMEVEEKVDHSLNKEEPSEIFFQPSGVRAQRYAAALHLAAPLVLGVYPVLVTNIQLVDNLHYFSHKIAT